MQRRAWAVRRSAPAPPRERKPLLEPYQGSPPGRIRPPRSMARRPSGTGGGPPSGRTPPCPVRPTDPCPVPEAALGHSLQCRPRPRDAASAGRRHRRQSRTALHSAPVAGGIRDKVPRTTCDAAVARRGESRGDSVRTARGSPPRSPGFGGWVPHRPRRHRTDARDPSPDTGADALRGRSRGGAP